MPLDQALEQHYAIVKGSSGAVGLSESPSACSKWMVIGTEQARLLMEFEEIINERTDNIIKHIEADVAHQHDFWKEALKLGDTKKLIGNSFLQEEN